MFKQRPTFDTAMGLFSKAREELAEASRLNDADLKEAQQKLDSCVQEKASIDHASSFLDNILNGSKSDAPTENVPN